MAEKQNIALSVFCSPTHKCFLVFVGFKSAFPLKSTQSAPPPPPPPGLGSVVSKPPPGFTGIPLNSNVVESSVSDVNRLELIGVCVM